MRSRLWLWRLAALVGLATLLAATPALATDLVAGEEIYRLEAGQVVADDLIVTAREIYIDGTVRGDLVAFGGFVEVNGTVEGDLLAIAAEVRVNGAVGDDMRAGGAGVIINGAIGDHLLAAAGGSETGIDFVPPIGGRPVSQGLVIAPGASVGGGALVGAGEAQIDGAIGGDLSVGAGRARLSGAVEGDAQLSVGTFDLADTARISGQLTYSAPEPITVPAQVASEVRFEEQPAPQDARGPDLIGQLVRLLLTLAGFALLGWLLLRFAPRVVEQPARAIAIRPGQAALYGLGAALLLFVVPVLSGLILGAIILFWGPLPGVMFFLLLAAALVLTWTLSPLITGLWLGQALLMATGRPASRLVALLVGVALIVLLGMVPLLGWLIYLASFLLAVGGALLARSGALDRRTDSFIGAPA
jgi:cytoskeletal protein CcmA (bactofilin family)